MRPSLRRGPTTCGSCGAGLVADAGWCGSCGARVAGPTPEVGDDHVVELTDEPVRERETVTGRWVALLVLAGLVLGGLTAVALRPEPLVPLLGHVGVGTGMTSSGLPPDDLRLAWSHDLPDEGWWSDLGDLVAADGLARIGGRVVDVRTGEVLRTAAIHYGPLEREAARLSGDEIVVVDQLLGTVVTRVTLPRTLPATPLWPAARVGDVTFLAGDEGAWFVRDDGTVLAAMPGWHQVWEQQPAQASVVALRSDLDMESGPTGDLRLVSLHDASVLVAREVPAGDALHVQVEGDRALLGWRRGAEGRGVTEGDGSVWELELVDAASGDVLMTGSLGTAPDGSPPRLLGRSPVGGSLLGVHEMEGYEVWELVPGEEPALRTTLAPGHTGPWGALAEHGWPGAAALTDDALVVGLAPAETVEARTLDGEVVWRTAATGAAGVMVDGDVVAVVPEPGPAGSGGSVVRFLDARDGTRLGSTVLTGSLDAARWGPRPSAVVGRAVAVAHHGGGPGAATELGSARWIDLVSGVVVAPADVFAPWMDGADLGRSTTWLHGVATDTATGLPAPVVVRQGDDGSVAVLTDRAMVEYEVPLSSAARRDGSHVQPLGATEARLAVWTEHWDHEGGSWATHLIDRASGEVRELAGVFGMLLTDDLLVGTAPDALPSRQAPLVAHDVVTGARRWTGPPHPVWSDPPLHDDELAVVGDTVRRSAVDLADGGVLWTYLPDEELLPIGVLGASQVLFATPGGTVLALDRGTGDELWRRDMGAPITSLTGAGDGAVVTTLDRELLVLDRHGEALQRVVLEDVALHAAALGETVVVQYLDRVVGLRADGAGFTTGDEVELP